MRFFITTIMLFMFLSFHYSNTFKSNKIEKKHVKQKFDILWQNNKPMFLLFHHYVYEKGKRRFNEPEWLDLKDRYGLVHDDGRLMPYVEKNIKKLMRPKRKNIFQKLLCIFR